MKFPEYIKKGDTIGVCATSAGITGDVLPIRLDNSITNVKALGYNVVEAPSLRKCVKCASADGQTRAAEFMSMYENPDIKAILPPTGGNFLMEMLPYLDFEKLASLPPKWVCGYSDTTTLLFPLTLICDMATIHGSKFMNMGFTRIHDSDMRAFDVLSNEATVQKSWDAWGDYTSWDDFTLEVYKLDNPSTWKSLQGDTRVSFTGRMIGGCMDTISRLIGTRFAPVEAFLNKYKEDGFIWTLESCLMNVLELYRALWQLRECGWFKYCNGIIIGRSDKYQDKRDVTLADALQKGLGDLNVPVIYDADVGHIPPQIQIVNGAIGKLEFADGKATLWQTVKA